MTSNHVDQVEHVGDRGRRGGRVQRHGGGFTGVGDVAERAVQVQARFGVHADQAATGLDVAGQQLVGGLDHEVGLERHLDGFRQAAMTSGRT